MYEPQSGRGGEAPAARVTPCFWDTNYWERETVNGMEKKTNGEQQKRKTKTNNENKNENKKRNHKTNKKQKQETKQTTKQKTRTLNEKKQTKNNNNKTWTKNENKKQKTENKKQKTKLKTTNSTTVAKGAHKRPSRDSYVTISVKKALSSRRNGSFFWRWLLLFSPDYEDLYFLFYRKRLLCSFFLQRLSPFWKKKNERC